VCVVEVELLVAELKIAHATLKPLRNKSSRLEVSLPNHREEDWRALNKVSPRGVCQKILSKSWLHHETKQHNTLVFNTILNFLLFYL